MGIKEHLAGNLSNNLSNSLEVYFSTQLDELGLSEAQIRNQSLEQLHRSLETIEKALDRHESFGVLHQKVSGSAGTLVVTTRSEATFERGITPLLLKRRQLVLELINEYEVAQNKGESSEFIGKAFIRQQIDEVAEAEMRRRVWVFVSILAIIWIILLLLIVRYGWEAMEPWTYLAGLGLTIGGYAYFAIKQQELSPSAIYQSALEDRVLQLYKFYGVGSG